MEAAAAARNVDSMGSMEEEPEEEPDPLIEYFQQPQMPAWMMQARDHNPTCEKLDLRPTSKSSEHPVAENLVSTSTLAKASS